MFKTSLLLFFSLTVLASCSSSRRSVLDMDAVCKYNFDPVSTELYEVTTAKKKQTKKEKDIVAKVKDRNIIEFHDVDFSELPAGKYTTQQTFIYYQGHAEGESEPNIKDGKKDTTAGFKISGIERKSTYKEKEKGNGEWTSELNCLKNTNLAPDFKAADLRVTTVRDIEVLKGENGASSFSMNTSTFRFMENFERSPDRALLFFEKIDEGTSNEKPSDFFKAGDINGENYEAKLYKVKGIGSHRKKDVFELHSQLNTGTYTIQSIVTFIAE